LLDQQRGNTQIGTCAAGLETSISALRLGSAHWNVGQDDGLVRNTPNQEITK
jgi:hypothetical protein